MPTVYWKKKSVSTIIGAMSEKIDIKKLVGNLSEKAQAVFHIVRKPLLIGGTVLAGLALLITLGYFLGQGGIAMLKSDSKKGASQFVLTQHSIGPEELYLPPEPDYIPSLLLARPQKKVWTPRDAAPYWRDPLKVQNNADIQNMRNTVKMSVDSIMEGIR
jgi:hypothetical protein